MNNVLAYLEQSAVRVPQKTAFADRDSAVNFADARQMSRNIGAHLAGFLGEHAHRGQPVAVLMEKSVLTLEIFFGAVYAGCAYSLLEPGHPTARLNQILDTLKPQILVTDEAHLQIAQALQYSGRIFLAEELTVPAKAEDFTAVWSPECEAAGDPFWNAPLYINFTSGSTGVPKGVVVGHASVIEFIDTFVEVCGITEDDVIGNQAPFDFDVSVKDIYSSIKLGATMQILAKDLFPFPVRIIDFLIEREITVCTWAVSSLCIVTTMNGFAYKVPEKIRRVIFSGEVMPIKHLNKWMAALPQCRFINVYGPTEITCNCTYYIIDRTFDPGEQIPIGKAFPGEDVFLLDEQSEPVTEPGVPGEICVGEPSLALGYYNNPVQTARAFTEDPRGKSDRIYHTGDLAHYLEDGNLMFDGRKDHQIKHMGHRIELHEIELAMEKLDKMVRCCVLYDEAKQKLIACYEGEIDKKEIVEGLQSQVPVFMIPGRFLQMEHLPLNKNGKIDRQKLKEEALWQKRRS